MSDQQRHDGYVAGPFRAERVEHSKEPWREAGTPGGNHYGAIVCDEGRSDIKGADDAEYYGGHLVAESCCAADRRRIIACVNVLAGVPTEMLERVLNAGVRIHVFDDRGGINIDLVERDAEVPHG